jgi:hypothetical protein
MNYSNLLKCFQFFLSLFMKILDQDLDWATAPIRTIPQLISHSTLCILRYGLRHEIYHIKMGKLCVDILKYVVINSTSL